MSWMMKVSSQVCGLSLASWQCFGIALIYSRCRSLVQESVEPRFLVIESLSVCHMPVEDRFRSPFGQPVVDQVKVAPSESKFHADCRPVQTSPGMFQRSALLDSR